MVGRCFLGVDGKILTDNENIKISVILYFVYKYKRLNEELKKVSWFDKTEST